MIMNKINLLEGLSRPVNRKIDTLQEQGSQEKKKRSSKVANCHICGKKYKNKYIMFCHLKQIHDMNPHICKYCDESFINLKTMREHIEDEHLKYKQTSSYNQLESSLSRLMNQGITQPLNNCKEIQFDNKNINSGANEDFMSKGDMIEGISPTRRKKAKIYDCEENQEISVVKNSKNFNNKSQEVIKQVKCFNSLTETDCGSNHQQEINSSNTLSLNQNNQQQIVLQKISTNNKQQLNKVLLKLIEKEQQQNKNFEQQYKLNFFNNNISNIKEDQKHIEGIFDENISEDTQISSNSKTFKPKVLYYQGQQML